MQIHRRVCTCTSTSTTVTLALVKNIAAVIYNNIIHYFKSSRPKLTFVSAYNHRRIYTYIVCVCECVCSVCDFLHEQNRIRFHSHFIASSTVILFVEQFSLQCRRRLFLKISSSHIQYFRF